MCIYIYIYTYIHVLYIYIYIIIITIIISSIQLWATRLAIRITATAATYEAELGIHYRGVQWEGGAVEWGSIIELNSL